MTRLVMAVSVVLAVLVAVPADAQTTLDRTTLSAAVTSTSATTITVASNTGITANTTGLFVGREYMVVTSVSGTTISVIRGQSGTRSTTHASGANVLVTVAGSTGSVDQAGSCTAGEGAAAYEPWVNLVTGTLWRCVSSEWQGSNEQNITWNSWPY